MASNQELIDLYASLRRAVSLEANAVLRETGLGLRQFIILRSLSQNAILKVSDLVELCMTDPATISRSVGQLIKLGYVEKVQCERDGRVFFVKLTKKGSGLVPEINKVHRELAERCFSTLRNDEKSQLAGLLREVIGHLDEVHGKIDANLRSS